MTVIRVSGVIVGASLDLEDSFCQEMIDKGVMTPESRFRRELDACDDDLEVRINSYGGDVFAGNAMIIALNRWAQTHPQRSVTMVVESLACSMAANMLVKAPERATILCHADSMLMFHSCTTFTWGGPEAHQDSAAFLTKLNASIIRALAVRTDYERSVIESWFQEGRMGWLDAHDAVEHLLADRIIGGAMEPPPPRPGNAPAEVEGLMAPVSQFFQCLDSVRASFNQPQGATMKPRNEECDDPEKKCPQEETPQEETPQEETTQEETPQEETTQEETPQEETTQKPEPETDPEKREDEVEGLRRELAAVKAQLDLANARLAKLTRGFAAPKGRKETSQDFESLVGAIPKGLSQREWDSRYIQLKHDHPAAFQSYMASRVRRTI